MTAKAILTDLESRRRAQTDFGRPLAVEAGAGTGKTTVLVNRILAWCLGPGWTQAEKRLEASKTDQVAAATLDGVLAITFTDAAASEMAKRLAESLAQIAAAEPESVIGFDPEDAVPEHDSHGLQGRARALIGGLDHLAIRTIHSHCWHLLATYPMAAGVSPNLKIDADGRLLEEVAREVVEEAVKEAYGSAKQTLILQLAGWSIDPRAILESVLELAKTGLTAEVLADDPLSTGRLETYRADLSASLHELGTILGPLVGHKNVKKGEEISDLCAITLREMKALGDDPSLEAFNESLRQITERWEGALSKLKKWSGNDLTKAEAAALTDSTSELSGSAGRMVDRLAVIKRLDLVLLDTARWALWPLIEEIEQRLVAAGVETYDSLLRRAFRLLSDHPEVALRERRRLELLLVDEFQDTDRLQCELVRILALAGDPEDRPSLFVVGDPKQSIYGWRNADLESYERFVASVVAAGGDHVSLSQNFRSVPAILKEVERVIDPVMKAVPGLQPAFEPLQPSDTLQDTTGLTAGNRSAIEYWVSWRLAGDSNSGGGATKAASALAVEAEAIARDIRDLHDQHNVAWADCGLLLRSSTPIDTFLEAFRRRGVPFVVARGKHFYQRREIIDMAGWVQAVINPVDHLALLTWLRSTAVGVPDVALLPLWQRSFPSEVTALTDLDAARLAKLRKLIDDVAASLPKEVPGIERVHGWDKSLAAALETMAGLRKSFRIDPSDRFIEKLRRLSLAEVSEAARYLGRYRLANLDRFFRQLQIDLEEQGGDVRAVARALRRSVARASEEDEGQPESSSEDAVQVMTIHGAKGLEFKHTYLPQLHVAPGHRGWNTTQFDGRWQPGDQAHYVLFGAPTPGFDKVTRHQDEIADAERVRTLYVAMTRARERLVLLGNWPEAPPSGGKARTFMHLMKRRIHLPQTLTEPLAETQRTGIVHQDTTGGLWRFPDLNAAPPSQATDSCASDDLPGKPFIKAEATRLIDARSAATARMNRPFSKTASAEAADRLSEVNAEEQEESESRTAREIALATGEVFHRMMECWQLGGEASVEMTKLRTSMLESLPALLKSTDIDSAASRFDALLERFRSGKIFARWLEISDHVVARELPVLLPPLDRDDSPVGYVSGSIDLIFRDPESGQLVIVDYKTDMIESAEDISDRTAAYQKQEAVYARALHEALQLDHPPACELWFVWPDVLQQSSSTPQP